MLVESFPSEELNGAACVHKYIGTADRVEPPRAGFDLGATFRVCWSGASPPLALSPEGYATIRTRAGRTWEIVRIHDPETIERGFAIASWCGPRVFLSIVLIQFKNLRWSICEYPFR